MAEILPQRIFDEMLGGAVRSANGEVLPAPPTLFSGVQQALEAMRSRMCEVFYGGEPQPTSEDKGMALLKRWLSPEQQRSLDEEGYFLVIGGDTGLTYQIKCPHWRPGFSHPGTGSSNVILLDERGAPHMRLCFGFTDGAIPDGDKMLAQMIALQNNENTVRLDIANYYSAEGWLLQPRA